MNINLEDLKLRLEELVDPTLNVTFKESEAIKHLGYDDEKDVITIIVAIGKLGGDNEKAVRRMIARVVKIEFGFSGIRLQLEESKIFNSIVRKPVEFIGIISGKGGVGKSSVACNIAYRLAKRKIGVGIIDADIYGSSIPTILGMPHQSPTYNSDKKIVPIIHKGIQVMSTEFFTDPGQPVIWRGGMLNSMISHFFYDVAWTEDTRYVIIDFPPGTGDVTLDVKNIVPQAKMLLVTTPHPSASHVAVKAGHACATLKHEVMGVIENMSYYVNPVNGEKEYIFGQGGGKKVADDLNVDLVAQLQIAQPKSNTDLFEIDEPNGKIYDDIVDYIIMKSTNIEK